ncbi:LysR substrate-binding domain-containing protein [Paenibacillus sp. sgz500958]|uniref:LysR substrate-binding domain-containing protein n=1 Tax=Paenibacillus sp. sgz500958 TaxID=3242475 RepID=UPI0036D32C1D
MKLNILVLIEKFKKVTDVAAELGLKQPTVSFHMKSLENELGSTLFEYRSGRVLLTDAGRVLFPYAVKIVTLASEAERSLQQYSSSSSLEFALLAGYIPGSYIFPKLMKPFMEKHPGAKITLGLQRDQLLRERLRSREISFALLHGNLIHDPSFNYRIVAEDEAVLICSPDHPMAHTPVITAERIANELWIQHPEGSYLRETTEKWAHLNQIRPNTIAEVDSPETLKRMVAAGTGIGIFSRAGIEDDLAMKRLHCIHLPGNLPEFGGFMLAWYKDYNLTALQQSLVDTVPEL